MPTKTPEEAERVRAHIVEGALALQGLHVRSAVTNGIPLTEAVRRLVAADAEAKT